MIKKITQWYYGKASIRKKLVISYLFLVAVPILVLGIYAYHNAKNHLLYQTKAAVRNNVDSLKADIESRLSRENDNIKYLSYNIKFRRALQNAKSDRIGIAQVLNDPIEPDFWYFITSDENLRSIVIYSSQVDTDVGSFLKPYAKCEDEPWAAFHEKNFATQWTFGDGDLFASRTLLDEETSSKPIGIMKIDVYLNNIISAVFQNDYLENGLLLLDSKGQVVYSRELNNKELQEQVMADILDGAAQNGKAQGKYLMDSEEIEYAGWTLYYFIDQDEIIGQTYNILRSTLYIVGILLIVIMILISILSKILGNRILDLKKAAEQVAGGKFDIRIQREYMDEIGVVAKSFYEMSKRLDEMIRENFELGKKQRAAELKALQAMINPHFLYNCLSSIKWKAIRAEQDEISEITGLLAKFYRTTLNGGQQITIVRNELDNVRAYLELQQKTHDDSFSVEYRMEQEGQELNMPNFLLQPIVENAVCHGIDYADEEKERRIIVKYEKRGEYLLFHIYNNGPRIELELLQAKLDRPGKGYGLYNIQERIRMYYDKECGVFTSISKEGYTCFTVKIKEKIELPI